MFDMGDFRLAETHKRFRVTKTEWVSKTKEQKARLYHRFRSAKIQDHKYVISKTNEAKSLLQKRTEKRKIS